MATASYIDENGNSVTAVTTMESGQTILRLTELSPNGKTVERTRRFGGKLSIVKALARIDAVIDPLYLTTSED